VRQGEARQPEVDEVRLLWSYHDLRTRLELAWIQLWDWDACVREAV
jgi:hypothetical protein